VPGADHHVPQTRPDAVAALILAFLDGAPAGASRG
jgi:pimeloyl-ACP methyl ester carboxylesterase